MPRFANPLRTAIACVLTGAIICAPLTAQDQQQASGYTFRVNSDLVLVNVVVRDKAGNLVRDLKRDDFIVQEDGKTQTIQSFDIQNPDAAAQGAGPNQSTANGTPRSTPGPKILAPKGSTDEIARDHRLIVLFFDLSAMQPEEVDRAVKSADSFLTKQMSPADLVAVITLGDSMQIAQDFTNDHDALQKVVDRIGGAQGQGFEAGSTGDTGSGEDTGAQFVADDTEYNLFNSDRRLQAISSLAQSLGRLQQKKQVLYFSGGLQRTGMENQSQLRAAINAAVRANVSLYAVDSRGLEALPPGGKAGQGSLRGVGAYSGTAVQGDLDSNFSSQETLVTLSNDTGGKAFLDSNDFSAAYKRVEDDTSTYYLLGYRSTNKAMDGKYRHIAVKLRRKDLKLEYRAGYYGPRDYQHFTKEDKEQQMEDELMAELPRTEIPVYMDTAYFRLQDDRYYVPVSLVIPASAIPVRGNAGDKTTAVLDILGIVREAGTKFPIGNVRDTVKVGVEAQSGSTRKNVQYSTGFNLSPGHYLMKFVVRDNMDGRIGTFETNLTVPDLRKAPLKMSSVVLSSQTGPAGKQKQNPLVHGGQEILPNLAHVFGSDQKMTVYFEVYDPGKTKNTDGKQAVRVLASLQFFSGKVKVFETPLIQTDSLADRKAAQFEMNVPLTDLKPGWYTCQLNVVDDGSGTFAFPRFAVRVDARR
jgi:VWFA-related protein